MRPVTCTAIVCIHTLFAYCIILTALFEIVQNKLDILTILPRNYIAEC